MGADDRDPAFMPATKPSAWRTTLAGLAAVLAASGVAAGAAGEAQQVA